MLATRPPRDAARLTALTASGLLDAPPSPALDRLTRLASRLLGTPVAAVSLVDAARQFFASAVGLPEPWASRRETPLSHSFCQHVVASGEPLVISDARESPLVCENLAIPDLGVVAYAGVPLVTSAGHVFGSLCAIDGVPHQWSDDDLATLQDLAVAVVAELELRTTTAALAETTVQFRELLDTTTELVCAADGEGRVTFVNRAWRTSFGYELDDVRGMRAVELVAVDDRGRFLDVARSLQAGAPTEEFEAVLLARDGRRVACRGRAVAWMVDDAASPTGRRCVGTRAVYRDVTSERQAEAARARLVGTLEASQDFVGTAGPDGRIVFLNRAGRRLLGLADDADLTALNASDFHPPETVARLVDDAFPAVLRDGSWTGDGHLRAGDGESIPVSMGVVAHPSLVPNEPPYFTAIMRDLRERVRVEEALRRSEARYRDAVEGSLDGFLALRAVRDPLGAVADFEFVEVSTRAAAMVRMVPEDVVGLQLCELFPLARMEGDFGRYVDVLESGVAREWETQPTDPRAAPRAVRIQAVPLDDGVAVSVRDVTAQWQAERERRLLLDVTQTVAASGDADAAIGAALGAMCEAAGWEYGEAWLMPADATADDASLRRGPVWHGAGDRRLAAFAEASAAYAFARGDGLAGLAWTRRTTVTRGDLQAEGVQLLRAGIARAAGLSAAVAVPVVADDVVLAVLVFHTRDTSRITPAGTDLVAAVAAQIGTVLRRVLAERALAESEAAIREREARFRGVLENVRSAAVTLDIAGTITFANDALCALTGWARDELLGANWFDRCVPNGAEVRAIFFDMVGRGDIPAHYENEILTRAGTRRLIAWDNTVLRGPDGAVCGTASIGRDVTEQKQSEEALRALALVDELTGMYNRRGFMTIADRAWQRAARDGKGVMLVYIDLDAFKAINDTHGHAEGDQALRVASDVLRAAFRGADVVGRLGGDEFAVLVVPTGVGGTPNGTHDMAGVERMIRERLALHLAASNESARRAGRPYDLAMSIGIARVAGAAEGEVSPPLTTLMVEADERLYEEKRARKATRGA